MGLMDSAAKLLDPYERKARLLPGLLLTLPASLSVMALWVDGQVWQKAILALCGTCGVPFLIANITRDAGKKLETKLVKKWGGLPSTIMLRHSDDYFDSHTKKQYHNALSRGTGVTMPTAAEEAADRKAADAAYRAAGLWLREKTKDRRKFNHVFRENIAYGFRRNITGLKYQGALLAFACAGLLILRPATLYFNTRNLEQALHQLTSFQFVALLTALVFTLVWLTCFSEASLRRTGEAYADRLIRASKEIRSVKKASLETA